MAEQKYCIHCLRPVNDFEADHVFPSSWYPESTPATVQRWTAPSCATCNRKFGQLEKDLLIRMVLCTNPHAEEAAGLATRVLRSLGLDVDGLGESEKPIRAKLLAQIRSELIPYAEAAALPGKIPGLGIDPVAAEWAIPISWAALSMIAEKIARGCEYKYKKRKRLIKEPYGVRTFVCESGAIPEPFAAACQPIDFGPGCKVHRVRVIEDPDIVFYWITIWGTLFFRVHINLLEALRVVPENERSKGFIPAEGQAMRVPAYLRSFEE